LCPLFRGKSTLKNAGQAGTRPAPPRTQILIAGSAVGQGFQVEPSCQLVFVARLFQFVNKRTRSTLRLFIFARGLANISSGRPVSRILSSVGFTVYAKKLLPVLRAWAIISLSSLPGTQMRRAASRPCLALLPAGVAWPPALLRTPVVSYTTFSP
jgi:hypothetical protein